MGPEPSPSGATELDTLRRNLRVFRELFENAVRPQGAFVVGVQGIADLKTLEAVLAGEIELRGALIRPLWAFSNMLASGGLPTAFSPSNFGDACVALGQLLESKDSARWRFDPDLRPDAAEQLELERAGTGLDRTQRENQRGWRRHARENVRFILNALDHAPGTGTAVIVGATRSFDLPFETIVARFERVIVVDVCAVDETRANIATTICDPAARARVSAERFDLTGSYNQFTSQVRAIVSGSNNEDDAERAIDHFLSGYDVPATVVRLCNAEVEPDVAVSSMVLTQLGIPFGPFVAGAFRASGFRPERVQKGMLSESLAAFAPRVEQHHIGALLRIPKLAVLTSDVSQSAVAVGPHREMVQLEPPRSQLGVPSLSGRIPSAVKPLMSAAWEWLRVVPKRSGAPGALMNVEGVVFQRA